jgi:5'/3'-nucleotidase
MRILITNDDGIHSPGLDLLERIAATLSDDVYVIAPENDQSGVAHSLSLNDPLRLREISPRHFAVKGTPTDCVIMAVRSVLADKRPDLVLSGVNRGSNVAEDVTYSGTIAGAMEGTILGVPSVALSQAYGPVSGRFNPHWDCTETHAPIVLRKLLDEGISPGTLINLNFPDCPPDQVKGIAVTVQGRRDAELLNIDARHDGRGIPYYWIAFQRGAFTPGKGTDLEAIAAKKISLTPLRLDLTDESAVTRYAEVFGRAGPEAKKERSGT